MDLALRLCPDIKVAGVAGPGDPLASEEALDTLSLIKQYHPELMACLSTNGLELAAQMERLLWVGVQTITVTVNAVDPKILIHLNRGIIKDGKFCGGKLGAITLIEAQERGIRMAKQNSMLVKINFVLVPGLNEWHIAEVAQKTQEWGADLLNIIPLIPASDLADYPAPTLPQLENAIQTAKKFLPVKRNCRHCRADACGIPGGQDFSPEIYGNLPQAETFSHG
jgi:nitrogen fixation protein NifB